MCMCMYMHMCMYHLMVFSATSSAHVMRVHHACEADVPMRKSARRHMIRKSTSPRSYISQPRRDHKSAAVSAYELASNRRCSTNFLPWCSR